MLYYPQFEPFLFMHHPQSALTFTCFCSCSLFLLVGTFHHFILHHLKLHSNPSLCIMLQHICHHCVARQPWPLHVHVINLAPTRVPNVILLKLNFTHVTFGHFTLHHVTLHSLCTLWMMVIHTYRHCMTGLIGALCVYVINVALNCPHVWADRMDHIMATSRISLFVTLRSSLYVCVSAQLTHNMFAVMCHGMRVAITINLVLIVLDLHAHHLHAMLCHLPPSSVFRLLIFHSIRPWLYVATRSTYAFLWRSWSPLCTKRCITFSLVSLRADTHTHAHTLQTHNHRSFPCVIQSPYNHPLAPSPSLHHIPRLIPRCQLTPHAWNTLKCHVPRWLTPMCEHFKPQLFVVASLGFTSLDTLAKYTHPCTHFDCAIVATVVGGHGKVERETMNTKSGHTYNVLAHEFFAKVFPKAFNNE